MKNNYEIRGDTVIIHIYTRRGEHFEAITSIDDLPKLLAWDYSWCVNDRRKTQYKDFRIVSTSYHPKKLNYLHRFILGVHDGNIKVDHIDHNTLNNRKDNLRLSTVSQNGQNRIRANCSSKSGVRGVYWRPREKKWYAELEVQGRAFYVGRFGELEKAETAVKKARAALMPYSQEAMEAAQEAMQ